MPKTPEELEKMFSELSDKTEKSRKDFELKLESATKDVIQYKELATQREEELRKFKEQSEKDKRDLTASQAKAKEQEILSYVEAQVKEGRILPAQKESVIAFMKSLTSDTEILSFTAKDGSKHSHTQLSLFKEFLSTFKAQIVLKKEYTAGEKPLPVLPFESQATLSQEGEEHFIEVKDFGEKELKKYPASGVEFAAKIFEFQEASAKAGRPVSYEQAMLEVSKRYGLDATIAS